MISSYFAKSDVLQYMYFNTVQFIMQEKDWTVLSCGAVYDTISS